MNDDLGTPAAVAVLYAAVRDGNVALDAGDADESPARLGEVTGMLEVLGLDADDPVWATDDRRRAADGRGRRAGRRAAEAAGGGPRHGEDFAAADAIRDALAALGVEVADTPTAPLVAHARGAGGMTMPGQQPAQGRRATASGKGNTAGSGGRVRRGPGGQGADAQGRGPAVPRGAPGQEDLRRGGRRPAAVRRRRGPAGPGSGPEWVAGRNAVLEAMEAEIPIKTAYVAEGAERDDRLRDILKLAAERGTALLEVTRAELDRLTGGAVHQGVALQLPAYEYAHPDDLLAAALAADDRPLVVALDSITDPRNLGAIVRSAAAFGAHGVLIPERRVGRDDRRRLEDLRRCGGPDADRPGDQPEPHAPRVRRRRLILVGLDGRPTPTSPTCPSSPGRWCWWWAARARGCPGWSARPATPRRHPDRRGWSR